VILVLLKVRQFSKGPGTMRGQPCLRVVSAEVRIEAWRGLQLFYVGMDDRMAE
jgi:hypothetical protein